jgi:hypothetical protein
MTGNGAVIDGRLPVWFGGLALAAALCGYAVAVADFSALYICVSLLACVFIFIDFRVGVVLLTILMPISASSIFPHNIAGITGLNPLNLLLIATLGSWFQQRSGGGSLAQLAPPPLRWWYVLPIAIGGLLGWPHVGEIPSYFYVLNLVSFDSATAYLRDMLLKPLFMVLFAVLVGAALARSKRRESFPLAMLVSVWLMVLMTIVFVYL